MERLDVKIAFLNALLKKLVYMEQLEVFEQSEGKVCKLQKSIYGLKALQKNQGTGMNVFLSVCLNLDLRDPIMIGAWI